MNQEVLPVFGPIEDLALGILRPYFEGTDVHVASTFVEGLPLPVVVARQDKKSGSMTHFSRDARFMRTALLSIDTICEGVDADQDASYLQEAVTHAIIQAWKNQTVVPGVGYISQIENIGNASRASDWATSTGVVQYASLPQGAVRYDSTMRLYIRPDRNQDLAKDINPFVRSNPTQ